MIKRLLVSFACVLSLHAADIRSGVPATITGPGGAQMSVSSGNAVIQPASGGSTQIVNGTVYVPTILDYSTTVSPTVSGSGHASVAFDGTNLLLSTNGGGYISMGGGAPAAGTLTGAALASNVVTSSLTSFGSVPTIAGTTSLTGGAGNMTITSGAGNSRTLILRTTTSVGTATTALTLGADQSATFGGPLLFSSDTAYDIGGAATNRPRNINCTSVTAYNGFSTSSTTGFFLNGGENLVNYQSAFRMRSNSGYTNDLVVTAANTTVGGDVVLSTAGKGLQLKSGTGQRAGNATLGGGAFTVSNTTVTASTLVLLTRKTAGGTIGDLTYTLNAGTSFTINSASGSDTSVVTYLLLELN